MITISDDLANAVFAESRSPIVQVTLEGYGIDDPTELIADGSLPYKLRRFQQGSTFYIATGYSGTGIYYKRMTTVENVADWNAGFAGVATATANGAKFHDMLISGNRVIVAYEKTNGYVYARESTDGGSSWNAEYAVEDFATDYDEDYAYWVSIADELTMFVAAAQEDVWPGTAVEVKAFTVYKLSRPNTASAWVVDGPWDLGSYMVGMSTNVLAENANIFARDLETGMYRVFGPMSKGPDNLSDSEFHWSFFVDVENEDWGILIPAFGGYSLDFQNYAWASNGLSRAFNDYYFTFVSEQYYPGNQGGYSEWSLFDIVERYHIARSDDLKGFSMIPWPDTKSMPFLCGIGLSESGDYICIPSSYEGSNGVVYLLPVSSWFGESVSATDITGYVVESIGINKQISKASTASMQVSCKTTDFSSSDITQPDSLVRILAGYVTAAGNELAERFYGHVVNYSRNVGPDNTLSVNLMDRLARATSVEERLPHILKGQNRFFTDLSDPLEIDMFAAQVGAFNVGGAVNNRIRSSTAGFNITYAGFEPSDATVIKSVIRFKESDSFTQIGFVVHGCTWVNPSDDVERAYHKVVYWYAATQKFVYGEMYTSGEWVSQSAHAISAGSLACSQQTDYWLRAQVKHGTVSVWYSTDGVTWVLALDDVELCKSEVGGSYLNLDSTGYVGLYAYVPEEIGQQVTWDDIAISSMYPPVTGSYAMKYLAAVAGLDSDEEKAIDDDFTGVSFSTQWDTPGVDGAWSVGGGFASGNKTGADYGMLACDVSAQDVVVEAVVEVASDPCGLFVRGSDTLDDCYGFMIDTTGAYIVVKSSGAWSTLEFVPETYTETYAKLTMVASGDFISGYVNNELRVFVRNQLHDEGYCGMVTDAPGVSPSSFDSFTIDAFYIPLDVVTVRPGDKIASVMDQIAGMYDEGYYFVSENGNLVWGVTSISALDVDARSRMITLAKNKDYNEIFTFVRIVGDNAYNEYVDVDWGRKLSGHKYTSIEDKYVSTKNACADIAEKTVTESLLIETNSIAIPGHPGLELGDVIKISDEPDEAGSNYVVLAFSETIGDTFEISINDLRTTFVESAA